MFTPRSSNDLNKLCVHDIPDSLLHTVEARLHSYIPDTSNTKIVLANDDHLFSQTAWPRKVTCGILVEQLEGEHRCLRFMVSIRSQQLLVMLDVHKWHVKKSRVRKKGESRSSMNRKRYGEDPRS